MLLMKQGENLRFVCVFLYLCIKEFIPNDVRILAEGVCNSVIGQFDGALRTRGSNASHHLSCAEPDCNVSAVAPTTSSLPTDHLSPDNFDFENL